MSEGPAVDAMAPQDPDAAAWGWATVAVAVLAGLAALASKERAR